MRPLKGLFGGGATAEGAGRATQHSMSRLYFVLPIPRFSKKSISVEDEDSTQVRAKVNQHRGQGGTSMADAQQMWIELLCFVGVNRVSVINDVHGSYLWV